MSGNRDFRVLLADQRWIRWSWTLSAISLGILAAVVLLHFLTGGPTLERVLVALLVAIAAGGLVFNRVAVTIWTDRRAEQDASLTRILRGLSRSISPDAVVAAILDELRGAAGADHVVVARLLPGGSTVQATLVSSNAAVPVSVVRFPLPAPSEVRDSVGRVAVPIVPDATDAGSWPRLGSLRRSRTGRVLAEAGAGRLSTRRSGGSGRSARELVGVALAGAGAAIDMRRATGPSAGASPAEAGAGPVVSRAASGIRHAGAAPTGGDRRQPRGHALAQQIADRVRVAYGLPHLLSVPLVSPEGVVGALVLSRRRDEPWSSDSRRLLDDAAEEVAAALARAYAHEAVQARATTDALTGLPNRGYFDELATLLGRGRRASDSLGMLMVDIDHFKRFNDRYGHAVGDAVLRAVADAIAASVRGDDVPARYGGEEFVVVLRRATRDQVVDVAERVRAAVRSTDLSSIGISGHVSVSVGAAVSRGEPPEELVGRADAALLEAKRLGRDRVVVG